MKFSSFENTQRLSEDGQPARQMNGRTNENYIRNSSNKFFLITRFLKKSLCCWVKQTSYYLLVDWVNSHADGDTIKNQLTGYIFKENKLLLTSNLIDKTKELRNKIWFLIKSAFWYLFLFLSIAHVTLRKKITCIQFDQY